jgi:hypothetical protein
MTGDNKTVLTLPWAILLAGCVVAAAVLVSAIVPRSQVGRYVPVTRWWESEASGFGPAQKGTVTDVYDTVTGNRL